MNEKEQAVRAAVKRLVDDYEVEMQRMLARYERRRLYGANGEAEVLSS